MSAPPKIEVSNAQLEDLQHDICTRGSSLIWLYREMFCHGRANRKRGGNSVAEVHVPIAILNSFTRLDTHGRAYAINPSGWGTTRSAHLRAKAVQHGHFFSKFKRGGF